MTFKCDYCNNIFSSRGNLETHQKKALYCINKRGLVIHEKFNCDDCKKEFTEKRYLTKHLEKCNITKKYQDTTKLISIQSSRILDLEKQNKYKDEIITELKLQNSILVSKLDHFSKKSDWCTNLRFVARTTTSKQFLLLLFGNS